MAAVGLFAVLAMMGCGKSTSSAFDCNAACAKIYDQCKFYLVETSNQTAISKADCPTGCNQDPNKSQSLSCMQNAPCDDSAMRQCVAASGLDVQRS